MTRRPESRATLNFILRRSLGDSGMEAPFSVTAGRNSNEKLALAAALGLSLAATPAFGEDGVVYSSHGFENPPFVLNQPLVGQDGWVGVPPLSLSAAVISNELYFFWPAVGPGCGQPFAG